MSFYDSLGGKANDLRFDFQVITTINTRDGNTITIKARITEQRAKRICEKTFGKGSFLSMEEDIVIP